MNIEMNANDVSLHSVVEDYSPPSSLLVGGQEEEEDGEGGVVLGIRPYMFEPLAPAAYYMLAYMLAKLG